MLNSQRETPSLGSISDHLVSGSLEVSKQVGIVNIRVVDVRSVTQSVISMFLLMSSVLESETCLKWKITPSIYYLFIIYVFVSLKSIDIYDTFLLSQYIISR